MSYQSQALLSGDQSFTQRSRAALVQQSFIFLDDGRADIAGLAADLVRSDGPTTLTFYGLLAAAPGFADTAGNDDGTIDSSRIPDADLLAAVQAAYPTVAGLYFTEDGTRRELPTT